MKKYLTSFVFAFLVCIFAGIGTACSCSNVRVVEIYFERGSVDITKGDTLDCSPEGLGLVVLPSDASDKRVVFTIAQDKDANGNSFKVLDDSNKPTLTAINEGVATITAKSYDGVKIASIKVRVFPKSYSLSAPTGIKIDNTNQTVVWDKEYITLGNSATKLDEVFYEVKLNGEVKDASFENSFADFEAGVWNKLQIRSVSVPEKAHIKASSFSGEVKFYLLPTPTNLALNGGRLTWDKVEEADSYKVVVHKKNQQGELELFKEFSGITSNVFDLELNEAGDFAVIVKACPKASETNKYISRASNQVSLIKYGEVNRLKVQDDHLTWNAVAGAEEYNIVLLNKASNTESKINVKSSAIGQETFTFDLSTLNICGDYTARIETISNPTLGLNSKISTLSVDFTKLPLPKFNGIENNTLTWQDMPQGTKVRIFVEQTDLGVFDNSFTLPSYFGAGLYSLYAQSIGNGLNLVSSSKATEEEKYEIGKLEAPTTISNVGYDFTVNKVQNATDYHFIDVCDENSVIPAEISAKLIEIKDTKVLLHLTIPDKKNIANENLTFTDLYRNKYTLKVKAVGEKGGKYFDSEYSSNTNENKQAEITLHKMLPFSEVKGVRIGEHNLNFSCSNSDIFMAETNIDNKSLLNELSKYESWHCGSCVQNYVTTEYIRQTHLCPNCGTELNRITEKNEYSTRYYDTFLEVFRLTDKGEEEVFQKAISINSHQLSLIEMLNTKGGKLIFKMSYYGNNTTILHGDGVIAKEVKADEFGEYPDFIMWRAYEPLNLRVNGTKLEFDLFEDGGMDVFAIFDDADLSIVWEKARSVDLNNHILESGKEYNLYIQNLAATQNQQNIYWADSMAVPFTIGRLETPAIKFTSEGKIEFDIVENATEYIVVLNDQFGKKILATEAEEGKITFDYTELFGINRNIGISQIKVIASMGANSEILLINSYPSEVLTIKDILINSIEVENGNVLITPNMFDLSMQVWAKVDLALEDENQKVFEGEITYDSEKQKFVFEAYKHLASAGKYNLTLWTKYVGEQTNQLFFMQSGEYVLGNIFFVPLSRELTFNNNTAGNPIISWAGIDEAEKYEIWAKNIQTQEIIKQEVSKDITTFDLTNMSGLQTGIDYQIAVISIGKKSYTDLHGDIIQKSFAGTSFNEIFVQSIVFDSIPNYLQSYSTSSAFVKVGEVKEFKSSISGNELTLTWASDAGVEFDIYKNETYLATVQTNSYVANIDTQNEKVTTWRIKGKYIQQTNANSNKVYDSAISAPITIEVLNGVTNVIASGFLTFEHDKNDCEYKVEIFDENDANKLVFEHITNLKEIDLSGATELNPEHKFTIKVTAISNGVNYITSETATITTISKTATPILYLDSANKVFTTNNSGAYVRYLLSKYDDDAQDYTQNFASNVMSSANSNFDCLTLDGITSGKYKIWAVGMTSEIPTNEIFSSASNIFYFTLLKEVSGLRIQNGKITFSPVSGVTNYVIDINGIKHDIEIQDTAVDYVFETNLLDVVGTHNVNVTTKGNYLNPEANDFSCLLDSIKVELNNITKLATPTLVFQDGILQWGAVENAQGYKVIFKSSGKQDIEIVLSGNNLSLDVREVSFEDGIYSAFVVALGNDSLKYLSSAMSSAVQDIQIASSEDITISLSKENRRLEWNAVSGNVTYVVSFGNSANPSEYTFETQNNYFNFNETKQGKLIAGNYDCFVKVKGNNANILDGKSSNIINLTVLETLPTVFKSHTNEQVYEGKATINFDALSGINSYAIIVIKPDSTSEIINYEYDSENLPELTFAMPGNYFVGVYARGNYENTVDGGIYGLELTKLTTSTGLQLSYGEVDDYSTTLQFWSKLLMSNANFAKDVPTTFVFDTFFDETYYETNIYDSTSTASIVGFGRYFDGVLREDVTEFRMLIKVPQDSRYLSSDWAVVNVYIYKTPTITKIDGNQLYLELDANETQVAKDKLKGVSVEFFSLTNELIYGAILPYNASGVINLDSVISFLPSGELKARIRLIGDGETYAMSKVSNEIQFTKLGNINYTLSVINSGDRIGNIEIVWDEVQNAVSYEIYENGTYITTITNRSYEIDRRLEELNIASMKFAIRAVGTAGYLNSSTSPYLSVTRPQTDLQLKVDNVGNIVAVSSKDDNEDDPGLGFPNIPGFPGAEDNTHGSIFGNQNRIIITVNGKNYIAEDGIIEHLSELLEGNQAYDFKVKELQDIDLRFTKAIGANEEIVGYITNVNSYYSEIFTLNRLPDVSSIKVIDGYVYGKLPQLNEEFNADEIQGLDARLFKEVKTTDIVEGKETEVTKYFRIGAYVDVVWGNTTVRSIVPYDSSNLNQEVCLGLPPSGLNAQSLFNVKYRIVGYSENISTRYSSVVQVLQANILEDPTASIENGELKWSNIQNASKYGIFFYDVPNYSDNEQKAVDGLMDFNGTNFDIVNDYLINKDRAKTKAKFVNAGTVNLDLEGTLNELYPKLAFDSSITIVIVALGSASESSGITYLSSSGVRKVVKLYASPSNFMTKAGYLAYDTSSKSQQLEVDGVVFDWNNFKTSAIESYASIFPEVKNYSVKIRAIGDRQTSFSSVWSNAINVYRLDPVSSVWIDENGFLNFKITQLGSVGFNQLVEEKAFESIVIIANSNIELNLFSAYGLTVSSSNGVDIALGNAGQHKEGGELIYPNYKFGHLDFLEAGINSLKVFALGNSKTPKLSMNIISSSIFECENTFNKLATPTNLRIDKSTLTWGSVENANGYLVDIIGKAEGEGTNTFKTIEVNSTSLSLLDKSLFPQGSYTIQVRAKGSSNFLTSSISEGVEFKVFKTPQVSILDGEIKISTLDENTQKTIIGVHKVTGQTFTLKATNAENKEISVEVPDFITNEDGENIYLQDGEYLIKVQSAGNGISTIDSDYSTEITGNKLKQIDYISSYQGSLEWRALKNSDDKVVLDYKIYVSNEHLGTHQAKTAHVKVLEEDLTEEGYFRLDLPMEFVSFEGQVSVCIKALGNNFVDLNGSYSNMLSADKVKNVESFGVDTDGRLSWSFTGNSETALGFKVVLFDQGGSAYVENVDMINQLKCELPTQIVSPKGEKISLNAGKHNIAIKVVGQKINSNHYLSSICTPQVFDKILQTNSFVVENGRLRWERVLNATKYEISFTYKDSVTEIESEKEAQYVVESATGDLKVNEFRYLTMDSRTLPSGLYSSVRIRAIGGVIGENSFVNSSSVELKNVWKLDAPKDVQMELASESSSDLVFKFYPIKYSIESNDYLISNYRVKITNLNELSNIITYDFTVGDENTLPSVVNASTLIEHTFQSQSLGNGRYRLEIMAIAPNNANDLTENHAINSQYCTPLLVTKPTPPLNFTFDANLKCFKWDPPQGFENESVSYELHYITRQNAESAWSSIQKVIVEGKTLYYPPTLGEYKMVILASVANCLKSDYIGKNTTLKYYCDNINKAGTLLTFISDETYSVYGSNASLFAGGTGTQSDPYIISNEEQFSNMKYYSTSGFYFQLSANIGSRDDFIDYSTLVVGANNDGIKLASLGNEFKCTLNGNNKTIYLSNLPTLSDAVQGLFAYTNNATIKNLTIIMDAEDNPINVASDVANLKLGTLIGSATNTIIDGVSVYAKMILPHITGQATARMIYVGGIVGASSGNTSFNNCRFEGSIKFAEDTLAYSGENKIHAYVGGITAELASTGTNNIPFKRCINMAELSGTIVGGIVARSDYSFENCVNIGNISVLRSSSSVPQAGGIVAVMTLSNKKVSLVNCYNRATIISHLLTSAQNSYIGGILGKVDKAENYSEVAYLVIANNFNAGLIKNNSTIYKSTLGWLIGHTNSTTVNVVNSYNFCLDQTGAPSIVGAVGNVSINNQYAKPNNAPIDESTISNSGTNSIGSFFNNSTYIHSFQVSNGKLTIVNLSETLSVL